jgi:hypothetical protein
VQDGAHVRLVDAHAERVRRHHHADVVAQEAPLDRRAAVAVEPGVVRQRLLAQLARELGRQLLRSRARARVDDRRERSLAPQRLDHQRPLLVRGGPRHGEREVRPVEAGRHSHRVAQREAAHHVVRDLRGGRGGRGHDAGGAELAGGVAEPEVVRAEVVAPLRHAVRLVDHEEADPRRGDPLEEPGRREALRRDVEQPQVAARRGREHVAVGGRVLLGVDHRHPVAEAARLQRVDLVLHQRHERRDDDRQVVAQEGGELVAERLARAGRHDHEHVAALRRGGARLALAPAELAEAEVLVKAGLEVHALTVSPGSAGAVAP